MLRVWYPLVVVVFVLGRKVCGRRLLYDVLDGLFDLVLALGKWTCSHKFLLLAILGKVDVAKACYISVRKNAPGSNVVSVVRLVASSFANSGVKSLTWLPLYVVRNVPVSAWAAQKRAGLILVLLVVVLSGVSRVLPTCVSSKVVLVARAMGHPLCILPRIVLKVVWKVLVLVSSLVLSLIVQV